MLYGMLAALALVLSCGFSAGAGDYELLFQQAEQLSREHHYQEAIDRYQAALALRPGAPEALNNLAVMYYSTASYQKAWDLAGQALRARPNMTSAALIEGLAAIRCSRPGDAIAPLRQVLRADPANREALLGLASAQVGVGNLAQAARLYEQRTAQAPADAEAWYGRAVCYERLAEGASRELSRTPGGASYSKRLLGEFLLDRGDTQLAREAFGEAAQAEAPSARAREVYRRARELAGKSREAFSRLVSLAPDSWQAHLFLGDVERQNRKFPEALAHYRKAAALQPKSPGPLLGMATVYWELGQFNAAEGPLHEVLRMDPGARQATFELATIAVRRHQDADAAGLLESYLTAEPDALAARADLGRAYLHLGRYADAAAQLQQALDADQQGEIHFQLAAALRKLGRTAEADAAMRQSAALRQADLERAQKRTQGR